MGIEFKRCAVIDGKAYVSLDEAKKAKLVAIFENTDTEDRSPWTPLEIANKILEQSDAITDALTLSNRSRPSARKINGATRKPRKPKSNSALPDYTETQRPDGVQTAA